MADSEVQVIISGDAAGAVNAMQGAATAVKEGVAEIKESIESLKGVTEGIQSAFAGIAALFAGGIFKEVVQSTNEWTESAIQVSLALGVSTQSASAWNVAIKEVGGTSGDVAQAASGLTRQLKTHEKALNDMGIATRDSNGDLLDMNTIMTNAIETVNSYEAGTDRNLAAQTAFGRGVNANNPILRVHADTLAEAAQRAEELGLVVTGSAKAAFEQQRKAMADVNLVGQAMSAQIGQALIPVLIQLGQAFSGQASEAAQAFGQLIRWVGQAVLGLWYGLKELGTMVGGVAAAVAAAAHGDFSVAGEIMRSLKQDLKAMSDEGDRAIEKLGQAGALGKALSSGDDEGGHKHFNLQPKAIKKDDTRLQDFKNELTEMEQAEGDFDGKDLAMQLQFWQQKLAGTQAGLATDAKLRAEIQKEILSIEKKQHDEEIKEQQETIKTQETLDLGALAAKQAALAQELAMGKITQAQELAGEIQIQNQIYAVKKKALDDEIALAQFDELQQKKLKDQELILEQQHAAAVQKIQNQAAIDQRKTWDDLFKSMQSGFSSTIKNFLDGTASLGATIKGLFSDITNSIISAIANMAAKWLATSLEQLLESKTSAVGIIGGLAAQAAAGAFASTAAIPVVGPELAPAAAATAYSQTMAFTALASAAGGYDIPAGVNPLTQLHQQEMVLPASIANPLRKSLAAGAGGSSSSISVTAMDSRSVVKALQRNGTLATALKGLSTRFVRG